MTSIAELPGSSRTTPARHRAAVALLALGAVPISFGGLIVRHLEAATPWQLNAVRGAETSIHIASCGVRVGAEPWSHEHGAAALHESEPRREAVGRDGDDAHECTGCMTRG